MEISIRWNICRVCLQEERKNDKGTVDIKMLQIFGDDKKLVQHIYECSGVSMKPDDSLPDKICRKCIAILKYAVYFRKSCRQSNDYLNSIIQRTKSASSMFRPERNTENIIEDSLTDDPNIGYMLEQDDLLSMDKFESDKDEQEKEKNISNQILNKQKQNLKTLKGSGDGKQAPKEMTLSKVSRSDSIDETNYSIREGDETRAFEDHEDPIISYDGDNEEDEENDIMAIAEDEGMKNTINTEDEENHLNKSNNTENFIENEQKEKSRENKSQRKNSSDYFNKIDRQFLAIDRVESIAANEDDNGNENNTPSIEAVTIEDVKLEESHSSLYFIVNKDNAINNIDQQNDNDEDFMASDDNVEFLPQEDEEDEGEEDEPLEEEEIHHLEGEEQPDNDDEDADVLDQVTSTTIVTRDDIELLDNSSNMSQSTQDIDSEYVCDEFVIDESDSQNALVHSNVSENTKNPRTYSNLSAETKLRQLKKRSNSIIPARRKVHSSTSNSMSCDLCGNVFTNRQLLNAHMKVHRQEKTHECELCSKRFITACNLQAHMRIHTGEKPFECKFCGRRFSDRSTQLRHERIHTNEKPFSCDICGKTFALSTTLQAHLKVHSSERPYRCEPCAKSFKLAHQLKAHQNTHLHKAVEQLCS